MFDDPQLALADEAPPTASETAPEQGGTPKDQAPSVEDLALQRRISTTIRGDKRHFKKAFEAMRRDTRIAMKGHDKDWSDDKYKANITGRHVKAKTASLYAKNPKAVARRVDKIDFKVWNEDQQSLLMAFQTIQAAQAAAAASQQQATSDPAALMGHNGGPAMEPQLPPGFQQAQELVADFQQGMAERMQAQRIAKTLEKLFGHAIREQQPLGFKESMKQTVRRACTTGVGYAKLCYQRQMGPSPSVEYRLNDSRVRLEHLKALIEQQGNADGSVTDLEAEAAEIQHIIDDLTAAPEQVTSEGLVFDFPQSTRVIPDRLCRSLEGFVGARHLTLEYLYTPDEVKEIFGVDLGKKFKPYDASGKLADDTSDAYGTQGDMLEGDEIGHGEKPKGDLCLVWEYFDKAAGLVYYICDGREGFLKPPAKPDVYVDQFWPVWALTFNAVESEDELFPPSDVALLLDVQKEYNRSRDGKREHRRAARPRWVFSKGAFTDEDLTWLGSAPAFSATGLNIDPTKDIKTQLQAVPVPGVDPNLYDVGEIMADLQYVVGNSTAGMGAPSRGTATANSIAAGANATADQSSVDDLDNFLTAIVRGAGQILLREMSEATVMKVVGPGAVWPELTLQDIADELFLEIEAGSTGKPNQAIEIANWEKMLPFIMQMQGISPQWLARETLRRLDDRMDLTDALVDSLPSIVAQNRQAQATPGDPNAQPEAQGHNGVANGPAAPGGPAGRGAPMGAQSKAPPV